MRQGGGASASAQDSSNYGAHKEPTQFEFVIRSVVPRFLLEECHCSAVSTVAGLWVKRRGEGYG